MGRKRTSRARKVELVHRQVLVDWADRDGMIMHEVKSVVEEKTLARSVVGDVEQMLGSVAVGRSVVGK